MTLFHQEGVPADLQLPVPGDPIARTAAGCVDAVVACGVGCGVAAAVAAVSGGGGDLQLSLSVAQGAALSHWAFRDALGWDGGNRSVGKALLRQEVAMWDGTLATPGAAALRSAYMLAWPLAELHPIAGMAWTTLLAFEVASVGFTQDARKLGDYALGTRVVNERPDREGRLRDQADAEEVRRLRAEVEYLAPGLLARARARGAAEVWYTDLQEDLATQMAVEARASGTAAARKAQLSARGPQAAPAAVGGGAEEGPPETPGSVFSQPPPRFFTQKPALVKEGGGAPPPPKS